MIIGGVQLYKQAQKRLLLGLIAQFVYLPFMAFYRVNTRLLHTTFPALAFLFAVGISSLVKSLSMQHVRTTRKGIIVGVLFLVAIGLLEGVSRYPRWIITGNAPQVSVLRDVGFRLAKKQIPQGIMLEKGATVVYYSGQLRQFLPETDLATLVQYIQHTQNSKPVYLVVDSFHHYDPTIKELLSTQTPTFPIVEELREHQNRVRVFCLKRCQEFLQ
jgi:hypothetical protein